MITYFNDLYIQFKELNMPITINNQEDIKKMRDSGKLASEVLDFITPLIKPGITTEKIDSLCHEFMTKSKELSLLHLIMRRLDIPFPKSICTSVNNQICHGIPGEKILKKGDVVNIDITVIKDGYHGDTSRMFFVGEPSIQAKRLCEVTYQSMWLGIREVKAGAYLGDIGHAIQSYAESKSYSVVREFCGHGIGKVFHDEPQVLHYGTPGEGLKLEAGMIFTIEPMINAGKKDIKVLPDNWTVVTKDRSLSAQWEHTILVTRMVMRCLQYQKTRQHPF